MKFKASKIRSVRPAVNGEGIPIAVNAGFEKWFIKEINPYVSSMIEDYRISLINELKAPEVERFYAMDASIAGTFQALFKSINKNGKGYLMDYQKKSPQNSSKKVSNAADSSVDFSMSVAGIKEPRSTYSDNIRNTVDGYTYYNETLITDIHRKAHAQIYESVMASLTSTNPEEQGQAGIIAALKKIGIETKERTELIARDQTSKLYGALAVERMKENGVQYFRWMHVMESNAKNKGRIAWRVSHMALDGEVFRVDDPELWQTGKYFSRKGDIGIPGHAINCHCRMIPIVIPTRADLDSIEKKYGKKAAQDFSDAA